jgi:hypothetical protein
LEAVSVEVLVVSASAAVDLSEVRFAVGGNARLGWERVGGRSEVVVAAVVLSDAFQEALLVRGTVGVGDCWVGNTDGLSSDGVALAFLSVRAVGIVGASNL